MASTLNLERTLSIAAILVALASSLYSGLHSQSSLEYMTKADWNTFQLDYAKKSTTLEGKVENGFAGVSQQLASLNFVGTKDFQDFKDKTVQNQFELQKSIDFLKKDLESLQRDNITNANKIAIVEQRIAVLEALRSSK